MCEKVGKLRFLLCLCLRERGSVLVFNVTINLQFLLVLLIHLWVSQVPFLLGSHLRFVVEIIAFVASLLSFFWYRTTRNNFLEVFSSFFILLAN